MQLPFIKEVFSYLHTQHYRKALVCECKKREEVEVQYWTSFNSRNCSGMTKSLKYDCCWPSV